ncbi:MAG: hypothetical protein IT274_07130 [Chitinophagales bacterium]|nr:hypothetical protein [Chitinophagales bacterium]
MKTFTKTLWMSLIALSVASCKKDDLGTLGGDTDLPLTEVGNESSIYIDYDGEDVEQDLTLTVVRNDNGDVTYKVLVDFTGHPDSAFLVPLIPANLKDAQNRANFEVKLRITSEGIQDYINNSSKPFTLVKYDSKVGDTYAYEVDGKTLTRTVTENNGLNEWPLGFFNIKTVEVQQTTFNPVMGALVNKMKYRANHKFGLVYMEAELKNGKTMEIEIVPWFLL